MLAACGYRFDGGEKITVSVPYVIGDEEGKLTNALISALSQSPKYHYVKNEGDWLLKVKVLDTLNDRIGYRYERGAKGRLKKNIIGIENRKEIIVNISVCDPCGGLILGPLIVSASADYDYTDNTTRKDLEFFNPSTDRKTSSIAFSLGQLDSIDGAQDDVLDPIYRQLARKIIDGLLIFDLVEEEPCCIPEFSECCAEEEEPIPPLEALDGE